MNKLVELFKKWLETSSRKQKWTAALFVFSIISTLGLLALKGQSASGSSDLLESTPYYFFSVFAKLIIVLLLIVGSSIFFRRYVQPSTSGRKIRQVQVVESVRLSPKQAVHLISVGGRHLLIGATDQNISLITSVEPSVPEAEPERSTTSMDFASLLQGINIHVSDISAK